ncbi:MAG: DUF4126 domain-containing protein [Chloroflexota bacterium]
METLIGLIVGIGLSATCGFRIFVPLLGMNMAQQAGYLNLSSGFEWVGSDIAFYAFGIALFFEILAYYIPWVDMILDTVATPLAVVAGIVVTASMLGDISPFLQWSLATIAGGGTAATTQAGSVAIRGASTALTGGAGNPIVSTFELILSIISTILAILLPVLAILLIALALYYVWKRVRSWRTQIAAQEAPAATA